VITTVAFLVTLAVLYVRSKYFTHWRIVVYTRPLKYSGGLHSGKKFVGVSLKLRKGFRTVLVNPTITSLGLNPAAEDFAEDMAEYRAKARTVARTLAAQERLNRERS
jgi:hypothetical protein